jgi:phage terminase large subunit GpA-like protein
MNPVLEAAAEVLQPGSDLGVCDWVNSHVKVIDSPKGGSYDINQTPWFREPLQEIADNSNDEIVIIAPVGSGKTALYEALAQWIIAEEPGGTMITFQTEGDAKYFYETRLEKAMKLCKPLAALWPENRFHSKRDGIIFPHMVLHLGGANMSNLQSKSMRWCIGDEPWIWKPGMMDEQRGRTHDRWNARIVFTSQGGDEGSDLHIAWEETDQRILHWQCEECEQLNKWVHSHIKYEIFRDSEDNYDWAKILDSVYMQCPHCEATYQDDSQTRRRLSDNSVYIATNTTAIKGKVGFNFSDYVIFSKSWGKTVERWIKAEDEKKKGNFIPLKKVIQKRLAEFWRLDYGDARTALIAADYNKTDYMNGELWEGELHRIMTVDVQRDHFWTSIRIWKADGSSRLIYESKVLTKESLREIQLTHKVHDKLVFIDAQYETGKVYDSCVEYNWTALHGSGKAYFSHKQKRGNMVKKFFSPVQTAQAPSGGRARYIFWSNEKIKDQLSILRAGHGMPWEIPGDVSDAYKLQIDSEVKRDEVNKKTGAVKQIYVKIKKDNHLWDTEAMSVAVAMMLGILSTSEDLES